MDNTFSEIWKIFMTATWYYLLKLRMCSLRFRRAVSQSQKFRDFVTSIIGPYGNVHYHCICAIGLFFDSLLLCRIYPFPSRLSELLFCFVSYFWRRYVFTVITLLSASLYFSKRGAYYGRPLSVSGRPCYILPMFYLFIYLFILWPPYSPAMVNGGSRKFYTW